MRLTIIPSDGFVAVDGVAKTQFLDIANCGIPADVHALQWFENQGWIEFTDNDGNPMTPKQANEDIYQLPQWAGNCYEVWLNYVPPVPSTIIPPEQITPVEILPQEPAV